VRVFKKVLSVYGGFSFLKIKSLVLLATEGNKNPSVVSRHTSQAGLHQQSDVWGCRLAAYSSSADGGDQL